MRDIRVTDHMVCVEQRIGFVNTGQTTLAAERIRQRAFLKTMVNAIWVCVFCVRSPPCDRVCVFVCHACNKLSKLMCACLLWPCLGVHFVHTHP